MTSGFPRPVFEGSGIAPEHHFEFVHQSKGHLFDTAPLDRVGAFRAAAENFLVDDLLVSRVREGPQTMRRTPVPPR